MIKYFLFLLICTHSLGSLAGHVDASIKFSTPEESNLSMFNPFDISPIQVDGQMLAKDSEFVSLAEAYKGRWVIVDISATWCGFCKMDQVFFSAHKNQIVDWASTSENLWDKDVVQVHLNIEYNKEGPYLQNQDILRRFLDPKWLQRDQSLNGVDRSNIDTYLVNVSHPHDFTKAKIESGNDLFKGFGGFPYQLVFNPDGKLVFEGNFTSVLDSDGDDWTAPYKRHYKMLTGLMDAE